MKLLFIFFKYANLIMKPNNILSFKLFGSIPSEILPVRFCNNDGILCFGTQISLWIILNLIPFISSWLIGLIVFDLIANNSGSSYNLFLYL